MNRDDVIDLLSSNPSSSSSHHFLSSLDRLNSQSPRRLTNANGGQHPFYMLQHPTETQTTLDFINSQKAPKTTTPKTTTPSTTNDFALQIKQLEEKALKLKYDSMLISPKLTSANQFLLDLASPRQSPSGCSINENKSFIPLSKLTDIKHEENYLKQVK
jgi:hypothetical protein